MKIHLDEFGPDRFWPEACRALKAVPLNTTFQEDWGTRSPLGIYNTSLQILPRRFKSVLEKLESIQKEPLEAGPNFTNFTESLIDSHQQLLYSICEYIEDCENVGKIFFPNSATTKSEPSLKALKKTLKPYDSYAGRIVNSIKHRQGRAMFVQAKSRFFLIPGYNIQTIIKPDTIGPDPVIHPRSKNSIAAISFAYDIRKLFHIVYSVSRILYRFILNKMDNFDKCGKTSFDLDSNEKFPACEWAYEIALRISNLPNFVFPHEVMPPLPVVTAGQIANESDPSNNRRWLCTEMAPSGGAFVSFSNLKVTVTYIGDGATRSFSVL